MATRSKHGFTLVELMVSITIVGILAALAVTAYNRYIQKAQRADGKAALLQLQIEEEKYRANSTSYGTLAELNMSGVSDGGYFNLSISNLSATGYILTAARRDQSVVDTTNGTSCTTLTLTVTGVTETKAPAACW